MAHDVFISYSSTDKAVADAVCAALEQRRTRCWIAPRDVLAGTNYGAALIDAINDSRVMVLLFSSSSNISPQVIREVERAVSKGIPILPFRIEDVPLSKDMEFFIRIPHWLDALTPPLEQHIETLCENVTLLLGREPAGARGPVARGNPRPAAGRGGASRRWWGVALGLLVVLAAAWLLVRQPHTVAVSAPAAATPPPDPGKVAELVKELAQRYREGRFDRAASDDWSSRPFTLAVIEVKGDLDAGRSRNFVAQLNGALHSLAGATVVDREILEQLLAELKLGSSELANPATALKLGRLFAAGVIATGTVAQENGNTSALFRVTDTETTEILKVFAAQAPAKGGDGPLCEDLARQVGAWQREAFPVRGRVLAVEGGRCRVNLGTGHGLRKGGRLELVADPEGTGAVSGSRGELELVEVGKDSSLAVVPETCRGLKAGDKVRLKI